MTLRRVISGGQNGVDLAALLAARDLGLETGGTMPRGFRTLDGPRPQYARSFGTVEHASSSYPPRTLRNVEDSDATLRIAADFDSAGEKCTWAAIVRCRRPYLDVPLSLHGAREFMADQTPESVAAWIEKIGVRTLNVAGNSERTSPGIGAFARRYLGAVFGLLAEGRVRA